MIDAIAGLGEMGKAMEWGARISVHWHGAGIVRRGKDLAKQKGSYETKAAVKASSTTLYADF